MNVTNPPQFDPHVIKQLLSSAGVIPPPTQSAPPAHELISADVVISVTRFRNVLDPNDWDKSKRPPESMLTEHDLAMPWQSKPWVYLKRSGLQALQGAPVIRVSSAGAILRIVITVPDKSGDEAAPEKSDSYHPVGISFTRVDEKFEPKAVLFTTALRPEASPFSDLKITPSMVQFKVTPLHGLRGADGKWASHITYKFWIMIQRARDGALGVIDPYEENENPP